MSTIVDCLMEDPIAPPVRLSSSLEELRPLPRPHRHSCQIHRFPPVVQARRKSSRRSSTSSHRRRRMSSVSNGTQKKWLTEEQRVKEKRRRRVVYVVVGMFLFILFSCVFVVIVTLTNQRHDGDSDRSIDDVDVRKENEELMNSLAQDTTNRDSLQNLTASVPVDSK